MESLIFFRYFFNHLHLRIIIKKHSIVLIMADEDEVISANNNDEVFEYMGGDMVVPDDVVRAQVHPSVTVIPEKAFKVGED